MELTDPGARPTHAEVVTATNPLRKYPASRTHSEAPYNACPSFHRVPVVGVASTPPLVAAYVAASMVTVMVMS